MKDLKGSLKEKIALLRIRGGDAEAYGFLYDRYSQRIFRFIRFRISNEDAAYDLMQDVFLAAWEVCSREPVKNVEALLYRIARNKIVDHYRSREQQASLIDDIDEASIPRDHGRAAQRLEIEMLLTVAQRLKGEYQDVIALRYVEGLSIKQISVIIEKEEATVRVTIHRAVEALRRIATETKPSKSK